MQKSVKLSPQFIKILRSRSKTIAPNLGLRPTRKCVTPAPMSKVKPRTIHDLSDEEIETLLKAKVCALTFPGTDPNQFYTDLGIDLMLPFLTEDMWGRAIHCFLYKHARAIICSPETCPSHHPHHFEIQSHALFNGFVGGQKIDFMIIAEQVLSSWTYSLRKLIPPKLFLYSLAEKNSSIWDSWIL